MLFNMNSKTDGLFYDTDSGHHKRCLLLDGVIYEESKNQERIDRFYEDYYDQDLPDSVTVFGDGFDPHNTLAGLAIAAAASDSNAIRTITELSDIEAVRLWEHKLDALGTNSPAEKYLELLEGAPRYSPSKESLEDFIRGKG